MTGTVPREDESLIGLVIRAAATNHIDRTVTIVKAVSEVAHAHVNLAARIDVDFAQLAWATRVAPHEVEVRRYAAINITPDLPGVMFHGASVPSYDLRLKARRLAPAWLSGSPYHSALGHHGLVTHCPVSGEILINQCPRCGAGLTWSGTSITGCRACGLDLRGHAAEKVPEATRRSTRLMIDLVHPHPARSSKAASSLPDSLRHLDRGTTFELGWRLGCLFTGIGLKDRDGAWKLPVDSRLSILTAGSRALASWPMSLQDAIAGRLDRHGGGGVAILVEDIRTHLRARNAPAELRRIVLEALPALATSKAAAVKAVVDDGANAAEATRVLGVSQRIFERLAKARELKVVLNSGSVNNHRIIHGAALAPLAAMIADRVSVGTISQQLGISRHGVEQLCCLGVIEPLYDTAMRTAFADDHVRRSDYETLLDEIDRAARRWATLDQSASTISLRRAVMTIGRREKPWGLILRAMRDGTLPFRLREPTANGDLVDRVVLEERDIPKVTAMVFLRGRHPDFPFEDRIKRQDVEELLNLKPKRFQQALLQGEVKRGEDRLYDLGAMIGLAEEKISGGEILARWSADGRTMPQPFRGRKRLERPRHLGWDRNLVEMMMAEHV